MNVIVLVIIWSGKKTKKVQCTLRIDTLDKYANGLNYRFIIYSRLTIGHGDLSKGLLTSSLERLFQELVYLQDDHWPVLFNTGRNDESEERTSETRHMGLVSLFEVLSFVVHQSSCRTEDPMTRPLASGGAYRLP